MSVGAPRVVTLPRADWRRRIGFLMLVLGAFWAVVGICITVLPSGKASADAGIFNALMALVLLFLPGLYVWTSARAIAARSDRIERLAALAAIDARMSLVDAGATLGVPVADVRVLLLDAVSAGLLAGHIDSEKGIFLSATVEHAIATRDVVCSRCGGRSSAVLRADEASICGYCGAPAVVAAP